jgi:hypothetical protein
MTRSHRRAVLEGAPRALSRTCTVREAADLLGLLGPEPPATGETFAERARGLVKQLAAARSRRAGDAADDVPDPIGAPLEVHQQVGELVTEAVVPVLDRLVALRVTPADGQTRAGHRPDQAPPRLHLAS